MRGYRLETAAVKMSAAVKLFMILSVVSGARRRPASVLALLAIVSSQGFPRVSSHPAAVADLLELQHPALSGLALRR